MPSTDRFLPNVALDAGDERFLSLLSDVLARIPSATPALSTVGAVRLRRRGTRAAFAGLTHWKYGKRRDGGESAAPHQGRQTLSFYSGLLDQLSDLAYAAVIAHELAHAWLNEHVLPEESEARELEADDLARRWGFKEELDALEDETESV